MKKLYFDMQGRTFKYSVLDYIESEDGQFLIFTDTFDGIERRIRKDLLLSEEETKE